MSVSQAAGYEGWYNSAATDAAKIKAGNIEATNHWFSNNAGKDVTLQIVMDQVARYNLPEDEEGHLYGAIISSVRDYKNKKGAGGKYAEYNLAFCAHYIGDLSMPLHNYLHDDFNKDHHSKNDATVEPSVIGDIGRIQQNMTDLEVKDESSLAQEISKVANKSRQVALKLVKDIET